MLSDEFYQEVIAHPIPTDLEAVKVLAAAPAVLDLFMWLTYRCFVARGPESIPIFGPCGLVAQIGSVEYSRQRRFTAKLEQWLRTIRVMWPACPARVVGGSASGARSRNRDSAVTDEPVIGREGGLHRPLARL